MTCSLWIFRDGSALGTQRKNAIWFWYEGREARENITEFTGGEVIKRIVFFF